MHDLQSLHKELRWYGRLLIIVTLLVIFCLSFSTVTMIRHAQNKEAVREETKLWLDSVLSQTLDEQYNLQLTY